MTRVLIVDDREESRYFLNSLLKGNDYEVMSACHGAEALAQARKNPPHLIISDLLMPVMDGYTLLREWRTDKKLCHIPFIVYTATYTDPKDEELALSLGADAFMLKPAEPDDILARIKETLASHSAKSPITAFPSPLVTATRKLLTSPKKKDVKHLREYSEVLIHKLEDKMEALDRANRELQRHIAERRLVEESHDRLATAVEQATESIVITNTQGAILYVNPAFEKITGYTREEILGENPRLLKSDKQDSAFYQEMWNTLVQGRPWSGHIINKKKNGSLYEEEMTISPVRDSTGTIVNYVAVKRDVTQEMALEAQLRQAQKMEAIGQLAGGVAHDFNNILTVIQGNASMLLKEQLKPEETKECTEQIYIAAERAAILTRQLLMFSRKQTLRSSNLNLNELVENMIKMLKRVLGEDITLHSQLMANLPPTLADSGMIEQILLNLAVNARDAMPHGGKLTIATSSHSVRHPTSQHNEVIVPGEYVCLSVSDTGCGIPAEIQRHIFEPFFTTKEVGKGTGLGLATVHGIVQQHHGWIDVCSETGVGTTFHVYFPVAKGALVTQQIQTVTTHPPAGNETILIVEDDPSLCSLVELILKRCGYNILSAATGLSALDVWNANREQIHLLLTDVILPEGMNGFDLAKKLQSQKPELRVVYTSGYTAKANDGPPLLDGINFLPKPYSFYKLAQVVRYALDQDLHSK